MFLVWSWTTNLLGHLMLSQSCTHLQSLSEARHPPEKQTPANTFCSPTVLIGNHSTGPKIPSGVNCPIHVCKSHVSPLLCVKKGGTLHCLSGLASWRCPNIEKSSPYPYWTHPWAFQISLVTRRCIQRSAPLTLCKKLTFTEHSHRSRGSRNSLRPFRPSSLPALPLSQTELLFFGTICHKASNKDPPLHLLSQDPSWFGFLVIFDFFAVVRHLLWKSHKKIQRKSWSNVPPNCSLA